MSAAEAEVAELAGPVDLVLAGGRVIDPDSGLDAVRDVAVQGGRIVAVGDGPVEAAATVDVGGAVVAPGFIDLHSHAQTLAGLRLQALDGVTTALELEMGATPVARAYARAQGEGRPINFGYSASWILARMQLLDGAAADDPFPMYAANQRGRRWRQPAGPADVDRLLGLLEQQLADGAIGIGLLLGYAPETDPAEYQAVAALAQRLDVPTFTHGRFKSGTEPAGVRDGVAEIAAVAEQTGARMHVCHINSSSTKLIDRVADEVLAAQQRGARLTTEAYPYGSASTVIGAAFLAPEVLPQLGVGPSAITYLATGERVADVDRLVRLRETDPGGVVIIDWLDETHPDDKRCLLRSLSLPDSPIASDAMPLTVDGALGVDEWPPPARAVTHPRSVNCFARAFRWLVRDLGVFSLSEAVRRCSLLPAQMLAPTVPAMRAKGRIQPGADADIVVFDPDAIDDPATATQIRPSTGIAHVLVNGEFVVKDSALILDARPGRAIRSAV